MGDILAGLLGALLGDRFRSWRSRRHAAEGDFDCALRRDGHGWERGRARVSPGCLDFRRLSVRGVDPEGRSITVDWVSTEGRRPSGRESWGISPQAKIFRMTTSEGRMDWAVVAPSPEAAARSLQPLP